MILQKDRNILNNSRGGESVTYTAIATMENSGNYTCKVELGRVSKTVTVNVLVAGKSFLPQCASSEDRHLSRYDFSISNH